MSHCRSHAEREDYQWLKRGDNWQAQAERPWDTPLTPGGHKQGVALGNGIARHVAALGLPPVSRVFSSPMLRCCQTGSAAASVLGVAGLAVDPALSETICEEWYRSWGVPGANSDWGGPPGCTMGTPVPEADLHPAATGPVSRCHNRPERLAEYLAGEVTRQGGSVPGAGAGAAGGTRITVDTAYVPRWSGDTAGYTWGNFETHELLAHRMGGFVEWLHEQYPDETILCISHGGPTGALYKHLIPDGPSAVVGYVSPGSRPDKKVSL